MISNRSNFNEWLLLYTNLSSLKAKFDELLCTVQQQNPQIICITETFLKSTDPDSLVNIPNYKLFRQDRKHADGGGVSIYISNSITAQFSVTQLPVEIPNIEILVLRLSTQNFKVHVGCVYRSGRKATLDDTNALIMKLKEFETLENFIVTGDFNFPELTWPIRDSVDGNSPGRNFANFITNSILLQLVTEPTRFRNDDRPSVLDLVLVNDPSLLTPPEIGSPVGNSDHVTITSKIQVNSPITRNQSGMIQYEKVDYQGMSQYLSTINWQNSLSGLDVFDMWECLHVKVMEAKTNFTRYIKVYKNHLKPWITSKILPLIKHKRNLWKKYKRTRDTDDWQTHKNFSKTLKAQIDEARGKYEENIVNSRDVKKLFKYIRCSLSTKVTTPFLQRRDGTLCSDNLESAEELCRFFSEVFTQEPKDGNMPKMCSPRVISSIDNIDITAELVTRHIGKLKANSTPGLDQISSQLLKACADSLALPLSIIMRKSFSSGQLPDLWKTAVVTPIFKSGNKLDVRNYRPVSLTPVICKVMESILTEYMASFLITEGVIPKEQHGFVKGRSTTTNLLSCVNDWSKALDDGEPTDVIYLDFSKAFDRVPVRRLLHKLDHVGIRGIWQRWISSFLRGRKFKVRVGDSHSQLEDVTSGVPQGSVLGPLLYLVYSSDLVCHISTNKVLFADDTKVYCNPNVQQRQLQQDLFNISVWCSEWLLPLNISKCVVLHIGKNNPRIPYYLDNKHLAVVDSHNDLGVTVNSRLTWSEHIVSACRKANNMLYLLRKSFVRLSYPQFNEIYKLYVRPVIEYAGDVWCPDLTKDQNLLENVQRRATRVTFGRYRPSYEERLAMVNLISFKQRRLRGDLIKTFKVVRFNWGGLAGIFRLNLDPRLRGHQFKLNKENMKTRQRQFFLSNRVFSVWNGLPADVVSAESVNQFKNRLDALLFQG